MKKVIAVCMMLVLLVGMMTACGKKEDTASVYYLNFKPEQDAQWQELAEIYTEQTGVPVTVVTAAGGDYETTLMAEMGKSAKKRGLHLGPIPVFCIKCATFTDTVCPAMYFRNT